MIQNNLELVIQTVKRAQRQLTEVQNNPHIQNEIKNHLDFAEDIITDIQLDPQNIEDRRQLQQATDMLKILRHHIE